MLFEAIFGHESFQDPKCQTKVTCFWKASAASEEVPLFELDRARPRSGGGAVMLSSDTIMAAEGDRRYGYWTIGRYDLPEGSYVKIIINKRMGHTIFEDSAHVMLRVRADAALRRLNIPLTGHHMATVREGNIDGRYDIVPVEDFEELGIDVNPRYLKYHDTDKLNEVAVMQVLEQERSRFRPPPKPTEIITEAGEVRKVIRTQGKIRKITLRKPKG
jgi:hypothetical protein